MNETNLPSQAEQTANIAKSMLPSGLVLNNKWEILGHIASGGKGDIYRAHQISLERVVALKVISPDFVDSFKDNPDELESEKERFRREVRIMAGIRHPNVLQVFDYDIADVDDSPIEYLVMEYIPDATLRGTMPKQGFGPNVNEAVAWLKDYFIPVLEGVAAIHEAGIIHRDIKPENILLDGAIPKIADFGLARVLQQPGLTHTFHILGTIFYMPKEQFEDGAAVDARADVYVLGKLLYEAMTGKITNASRVVFKEVGLPPEILTASGVSTASDDFFRKLDAIIREATREEPDGRTASVTLMIDAIRAVLASHTEANSAQSTPKRERKLRRLFIVIIVLLLALIAFASYHFWNEAKMRDEMTGRNSESPPSLAAVPTKQPGQLRAAEDGATFRLMPGGKQKWLLEHDGMEETTPVEPFYAEESLVSNQRFIQYLNAVGNNLTVKDNAVILQGSVIFMLGEIREGYEPIKFRNGKFILQEQNAANEPVVRVSAAGALAYARYYGRELPNTAQWLTIKKQGMVASLPLAAIREWGMVRFGPKEQFYVFENFTDTSSLFCPLAREKWEAFADVGFRTVLPATKGGEQ